MIPSKTAKIFALQKVTLLNSTQNSINMAAALPQQFKPIQHYLKTASEHDKRDPVVAYYCEYKFYKITEKLICSQC